jgi:hypothetical protein
MTQTTPASEFTFASLLDRAVSEPGLISKAYTAFHAYSIGNQLLALVQCLARGITPGPIATFMSWKAKGRAVRKGERALVLCMPVTCKRREPLEQDDPETPTTFTRFMYVPRWFALSQTDGVGVEPERVGEWDAVRALAALQIAEVPFAHLDGNCQGYASGRTIAVSPVAAAPIKTRFHEFAHVLLGHTTDGAVTDDERTPRSLREVEAEAVALLCLEALSLPGAEYCRGYIQHWNAVRGGAPIPGRSAQKIFKAADAILRAGRASEEADVAVAA